MKQTQKTLYVTDLDGTLLNTSSTINQYSLDTINSLIDEGILFTYATARSLVSAEVVTAGLGVQIPVVAYNGAFIMDPVKKEILSSVTFEKEEVANIVELLKKEEISPLVYAYIDGVEKVSWVTEKENEGIRYYLSKRKGDKRFRPLVSPEKLYEGNIFYVTLIGEREALLPVYEAISKDDRFTCSLHQEIYREEYWCEILPKKATKAEGILALKEMLHCDKVISFGDAVNDIPMFQISDECYAVENAVEEVKACATGILADNDHDGVAVWLAKHCIDCFGHNPYNIETIVK